MAGLRRQGANGGQRLIGSEGQPMGGEWGGGGKVTGMAIRESHHLAAGGGGRTRQGLTCVYCLFAPNPTNKGNHWIWSIEMRGPAERKKEKSLRASIHCCRGSTENSLSWEKIRVLFVAINKYVAKIVGSANPSQ